MISNELRLLSSGPLPLYAQIAEDLRARIRKRAIPVGGKLPGLLEICETYAVSRITARQAISQLVDEGLVLSARGQRATVIRNDMEGRRPLYEVIEPNLNMAPDHIITILSHRVVQALPDEAGFYGVSIPPYVAIRKIHGEGGAPYCLMEGFVSQALYDRFPKGAELDQKLTRLVFDHADPPLESGRERQLVAGADATEAAALEIAVGAPVARLHRVLCDTLGHALYYGDFVYRGDRFGSERDLTPYVIEHW